MAAVIKIIIILGIILVFITSLVLNEYKDYIWNHIGFKDEDEDNSINEEC